MNGADVTIGPDSVQIESLLLKLSGAKSGDVLMVRGEINEARRLVHSLLESVSGLPKGTVADGVILAWAPKEIDMALEPTAAPPPIVSMPSIEPMAQAAE